MQLRPHHLALALIFLAAHANAQLSPLLPTGIASDATGNLYFADANRHQVFEATLGGQLVLIAGNGTQGLSGDNGPATAAQLNGPQSLAFGLDGTLYIADTGNHRIRAMSSGTITTFAGTGHLGFSGDNGPAVAATLASPNALAIGPDGALYIADSANHRIRRVAFGQITTIAGSGTQGFSGDNGPATAAALDTPSGLAISAAGLIYIADTHNHRIRLINASGTITTFAGTGKSGYSGDNAQATLAQLDSPRGLALTAAGALLITDANNQRLRSIASNGIITTLAGGPTQGLTADATPALAATLNTPRSVALTTFGYPVFSDATSHTLRILAADGNLYLPAALAVRTSNVSVSAPAATFGQTAATVTVAGATTPLGTVQLMLNSTLAATGTLASGTVTVPLTTTAAGNYTITAAYTGDGINPAATSPAVTLTITRATTTTTTQPPAQNTYATLPMLLNANVASATKGTPTGTVNFIDTSTNAQVATTQLTNGIASTVYLAPTAGTHTLAAAYLGDANFAPSTSPVVTATMQPLPDFTLATSGTTTQTVVSGFPATYSLTLASLATPFTGAVSFAVTGLPKGATAAFAPPQAVPGASTVPVVLTIQTPAQLVTSPPVTYPLFALAALPLLLIRKRRSWLALLALIALTACGTRINQPPSSAAGVYNLTVTGTGTNLAGALSVHTASLSLNVQ